MNDNNKINIQIYRSPLLEKEDKNKEGNYIEYEIIYQDRMTVMNACDYIHKYVDRSLAYYKSCRIGKCTGCIMEVNGKNELACTTLIKNNTKIGPAKGKKIIRDLLVE
jgi:succinate dehydrogenase / fumarate reductase, iron-sulfur subunit